MKKPDLYHGQQFSTRRIEALTDGVFAIAMTLLILDISASSFGHITTSAQLWQAIVNERYSITSFVMSFLLLGSLWAVHMRQFEYIERADRHLTMINTIRLLLVVFIPFTTSINGNYQDVILGRVLLPLNFFLLVTVSAWEWYYASNPKNGLNKIPQDILDYSDLRNKVIVCTAAVVTVASIWLTSAAFALFLIVPVVISKLNRGRTADI